MKKLKKYKDIIYKLRWSPEIEVEFPSKVNIEVLYDRYRKLLLSWTVTHDYSLANGLEFKPQKKNKLYFTKECFQEVSEILHIIRKHKGKINKNTCGLHIHIDASKFSDSEILKILKEIIVREQYLCQDFKVEKERIENMCRFIKSKDIKGLTEEKINKFRKRIQEYPNIPILNEKYFLLNMLNLRELNSLEFRLFNGSLYIKDIKASVKTLFEFLIIALEHT